MWGILHILDYLHWHNSRKLPLRRKHGRGKYSSCYGRPKTVSFRHYCDDVQEYLDAEAVPVLVDGQTANAGPTKISDKDHIQALLAKDMSARSGMQQTISIPNLESSDHTSSTTSTDWRNPIIILHKSADTNNLNTKDYSKVNQQSAEPSISSERWDKLENPSINRIPSDHREASCQQFRECTDVLELFQVNQDLFLEILKDADIQVTKSTDLDDTSITKLRLKKSGSFPVADSPLVHRMRPVRLEHKKMEIRPFPKVENFPTVTQKPKVVTSISFDGSHKKIKTGVCQDSAIGQDTSSSSLVSSQHLDKNGWRQSFITQFRDIKKKIKLALKELKKTKSHSTTVPLLSRVLKGNLLSSEKQNPEILEEALVQKHGVEHLRSCCETNGSNNNLSQGALTQMRRASSLNESLNRYACLFENTFSRQATWHQSKSRSLRLTSEDKFPVGGNGLKSFKRRLSLSELEYSCDFPNETPHNIANSRMGIRPVMDRDANFNSDGDVNDNNYLKPVSTVVYGKQLGRQETVEDSQTQDYMVERGSSSENNDSSSCSRSDMDVGFPTKCKEHGDLFETWQQDLFSHQDQNLGSINSTGIDEQTLLPVFETRYEDIIDKRGLLISQGIDSNTPSSCIHEPDSNANLQEKPIKDSVVQACCITSCVNMENGNRWTDNHFLHLESTWCNNNDFYYVRDVLEIAGLIGQNHAGRWHSLDQPLNPLVFKELEAYLHPEQNSSEEYTCSSDHQLLFDLMNELLLEIYDYSLAYFPEPLSFIQRRVSPPPNGGYALQEIWRRVTLLRRTQSLTDQSLDDIVAGDMENGDGWMKLTIEGEDVALDLEDIIFEQVLDEIMCI